MNPIKKILSSYDLNKGKKRFEEISKNNFDNDYNYIKSNKEIKGKLLLNKCNDLNIHSPQEL